MDPDADPEGPKTYGSSDPDPQHWFFISLCQRAFISFSYVYNFWSYIPVHVQWNKHAIFTCGWETLALSDMVNHIPYHSSAEDVRKSGVTLFSCSNFFSYLTKHMVLIQSRSWIWIRWKLVNPQRGFQPLIFSSTSEAIRQFKQIVHVNKLNQALFMLRVHLDIQVGEHAIDYANVAQKEKLSELQLRVRQLLDQVPYTHHTVRFLGSGQVFRGKE